MGEIIIHLPPYLEEGIENLVSRGIYKEKEEAIIAMIKAGLIAWRKRGETGVRPVRIKLKNCTNLRASYEPNKLI